MNKSIPQIKGLKQHGILGWAWTLVRPDWDKVWQRTNSQGNGLWDEGDKQITGTCQFNLSPFKEGKKVKNKVREQIRRQMTWNE